jgi:hypothetical protein
MESKLLSELAKGAWSGATAYTIGDIVSYLSSSYICIANHTNQAPPNASYWALLSSGIEWKGAWSAGTYSLQQAVEHDGTAYIANKTTTEEPSESASDWDLLAQKGADSTVAGPQGPQGNAGTDGTDGKEVQLQVSGGYIQWKYDTDVSWTNLIAVSELVGATGATGAAGADGTEIELQVTETYIQWRYVGGSWTNLVALSTITGPAGADGVDGADGADGVSFIWKGAWGTTTEYDLNDVVFQDGSSYICTEAHTSGTFATDLAAGKWEIVAQKGAAGEGSGDVLGPATNADSYIPQWDGINSKTLKAGIPTSTFAPALGTDDNYVTNAEKIVIGNTSGTNTGDQSASDFDIKDLTDSLSLMTTWSAKQDALTADVDYLTPGTAASTYQPAGSYLTDISGQDLSTADNTTSQFITQSDVDWVTNVPANETDPVFTASDAASITSTDITNLGNLSGTNTGDQDLTGLVAKSLYDAHTILYATTDNTPAALTVPEQTVVGRITSGNITALSVAQLQTLIFSSALGAEITLGENFGLTLDAALSADGKYSGICESGTAGAALAFGQLVYLNGDDSRWELVDANLSDGYDKKIGICVLAANADGDATKILLYGKVRADSQFPALTIGAPVYMSETPGDIVTTAPTTADVAIRVLGHGNTADELFFNPSPDYIVHV